MFQSAYQNGYTQFDYILPVLKIKKFTWHLTHFREMYILLRDILEMDRIQLYNHRKGELLNGIS